MKGNGFNSWYDGVPKLLITDWRGLKNAGASMSVGGGSSTTTCSGISSALCSRAVLTILSAACSSIWMEMSSLEAFDAPFEKPSNLSSGTQASNSTVDWVASAFDSALARTSRISNISTRDAYLGPYSFVSCTLSV